MLPIGIVKIKGSLQLWIEGTMTEGDRIDRNLASPRQREWALLRQVRWIFDALIHNDDRNLGNSLIDENWDLWLIDHTRSFYPFDRRLMEEQLTHIEAGLWDRLKTTSPEDVRQRRRISSKSARSRHCFDRWTRLVEHYQAAIEARGKQRVLFTLPASDS